MGNACSSSSLSSAAHLFAGGNLLASSTVLGLTGTEPRAMSSFFAPSSPTRRDPGPVVYGEFFINDFARLKTCDDPVVRQSYEQFCDSWLAAAEHQISLRPKSPPPEELEKRREERRRKGLLIALNTYAKRNNMQISQFEFVEEKERNLVDGRTLGYVHSNFVVRGVDGTLTLFFAELHLDCSKEADVVLCTPLQDNDSGHCFGCNRRAKKLRHPTCGGHLGGLEDVPFYLFEEDSDDEYFI